LAEPPKRRVVKKVDGGHGHHGGAWKVAYADFVTAMMALFMVMWLLASTDTQTRQEISNYFRTGIIPEGDLAKNHAAQFTPSVIEAAPSPPPPGDQSLSEDAATQLRNEMVRLGKFDEQIAEVVRGVHVEVTRDGVLIEIVDEGNNLLFDTASSKLKEPLNAFLKKLAPLLVKLDAFIEINGHTDAAPFVHGAKISNWDLSYQRASASRDILVGAGLDDKKLNGVFARGSSHPYDKSNPYAPQNRRISILVKIAKTAATSGTEIKHADPDDPATTLKDSLAPPPTPPP
jgi:chemotaxis protein MotB